MQFKHIIYNFITWYVLYQMLRRTSSDSAVGRRVTLACVTESVSLCQVSDTRFVATLPATASAKTCVGFTASVRYTAFQRKMKEMNT